MESDNDIMKIIQEFELTDDYEKVLERESDLEKQLLNIQQHYSTKTLCYRNSCESTAQLLLMAILKDSDLKDIHSARYRIKSFASLVTKFIMKKAVLSDNPKNNYNIEKYRPMTGNNYYKLITDLIGFRILIRYQQQWETVHQWIWNNFYKSDKPYIKNWLDNYPSATEDNFIVEKPKLYLREMNDQTMYQKFGNDIFEYLPSIEGYNSIHYLIWFNGKYVEIQVRTIYDEAWGECTHDLVYKCRHKARRANLEILSECLAIQTQAAGKIADRMFEQTQAASNSSKEEKVSSPPDDDNTSKSDFESLQKHIQYMNSSKEFDGSIDNLI